MNRICKALSRDLREHQGGPGREENEKSPGEEVRTSLSRAAGGNVNRFVSGGQFDRRLKHMLMCLPRKSTQRNVS